MGFDDITKYSKYFKVNAPSSLVEFVLLLLIGIVSGSVAMLIVHYTMLKEFDYRILAIGMIIGMLSISLPAFLTVLLIKTLNKRMKLKHALLSTIFVVIYYVFAFLLIAFSFALLKSIAISYFILVLANAGIYGYWFIMSNVVIGIRKRSATFTSAIHPVLNILFFLPFSAYLLGVSFPVNATLLRLFIGMLVFLAASYAFLYAVDRPVVKFLDSSGVKVMSAMLGYWLYNLSTDARLIGYDAASSRPVNMQLISIKGKASQGVSAVFVNPDIHFGPFVNAGGGIATGYMSRQIAKLEAAPFIIHTTVDLQDNPVSASEVYSMSKELMAQIKRQAEFKPVKGSVSFGKSRTCKVADIRLGDSRIFILSRAPHVTEDIQRSAGIVLKQFASRLCKTKRIIMVDAHNSRFESAPKSELAEISLKSPYIADYKKAMEEAVSKEQISKLKLGFAYRRLVELLGKRKDLGEGYSSVCVIGNSHERFCLVYIDANNMLPGFREEVLRHIRDKFKMEAELCTTDTHSVNLLSEDAGTALGRYTTPKMLIPVLDLLIGSAIGSMDEATYAYSELTIPNFKVWGPNAGKLIEKTSKAIRKTFIKVVPFIIIAAFVIAAWIISLV
ncbi:MAG: DUF2070 family protein [Candidatus Micrarchaeia archaeon]